MSAVYITEPKLAALPHVRHGFFTRRGGVSGGLYASLNCGLGSQDDRMKVVRNRERVETALNASMLVTLHQCHSDHVATITDINRIPRDHAADAMVTRLHAIALGILTADCAPVLLADAEAGVIGAAHAGWKGAFKGILANTVAAMEALGADRRRIAAAVGPAIAQESYQVDTVFHAEFLARDRQYERFFDRDTVRPSHYLFDLKGFVAARLREAGVARVETMPENTYVQEEDFYSFRRATHRREPDYGRQVSAIMLA